MKVVIVTNIPAPYRINVYELLKSNDYNVFFCSKNEGNRSWDSKKLNFKHIFLSEKVKNSGDNFTFIHNNLNVIRYLNFVKPDVVITCGFNPTYLYAFLWSLLKRKKHICMSDSSFFSEKKLSIAHKLIRSFVYKFSSSFIVASDSGKKLLNSYNIPGSKIFKSHLCANNAIFNCYKSFDDRSFDIMFSGQFHERKLPFLFVEVCVNLKKSFPNLKVLLIGDGPLKDDVLFLLKSHSINFDYAGFVSQDKLPAYYSNCKILLFTTRMDPWGVVANESMAAGTPVITTPFAGVSEELVINDFNGYICSTSAELWCEKACQYLNNPDLWSQHSIRCIDKVKDYTYLNASLGINDACEYVLNKDI